MADFFTVKIEDREVYRAIDRLHAKNRRMEPFFKRVGVYLVRSTKERFPTETDPEGRPWQKLKPATMAQKTTTRILREEGHLQDTIFYQADNGNVRVGSVRVYAAIHQLGGKTKPHVIKPSGKKALSWSGALHPVRSVNHPGSEIPARAYLGISRTDRERILEIAEDFMMEG